MGYKPKSDSYLMSMTKAQIIEELRVAEHNFFATEEGLNNSANAAMAVYKENKELKNLLHETICVLEVARFDSIQDSDDGDKLYDKIKEILKGEQNCLEETFSEKST